jgi:Phosphotransferase enzyme family
MHVFLCFVTNIGTSLVEYMSSVPRREIQWIRQFAKPRPEEDLFRRSDSQESPNVHIDLLQRWLNAITSVAAKMQFRRPSIMHMDLNVGNIFTEKGKITSIIDWQATEIRPLLLHASFPRLLDYDIGENPITLDMPKLPSNFDELDEEEKAAARAMLTAANVKKYWLAKTYRENKNLADAFFWKYRTLIQSLHLDAGRSWEEEVEAFRHGLMQLSDNWEEMELEGEKPVFTEAERMQHEEEIQEYNDMVEVLAEFDESLGLEEAGLVSHERYEAVVEANEELRRTMANRLGKGDEELTEKWYRWWPYSDNRE